MNNLKIISTSGESALKDIKLTPANLWMEPTLKREDTSFWVRRFESRRIPYVLAQYDTEFSSAKYGRMYRRVYGLFVDMDNLEQMDK
jgi:hypothetical protein